jgi:TRAP-type C4-dicarboxylate transport system substrate-binding protein
MDAAGVTSTGLGIIVRPVLVLSSPGLIETYEELERVRTKLTPKFEDMFREAGFELLAWADAGQGRLMSTKPILRPSDLRSARPWVWKDDPIFAEFLKVVGANGVRLGVPEVYGALQTKMVDVVPNSALGAVALQWYTKLNYMSKDTFGIIMGASIVKKEKFDQLTPADQAVFKDTAARAGKALDRVVRRDDAKAFQVLLDRGMQIVDSGPYLEEWEKAAAETRERLTGRVFSKSLLQEAEAAAKGP